MRVSARVGAVLIALVAAVLAGSAGTAFAAGGFGEITSRWSGRCFDMRAQDGTGNGVLLQQWDCTGKPEQEFSKLSFNGDADFLLVNQRSGRCLRPSGGATNAGALIEQTDCDVNDPSQHWQTFDPGANSTGAKFLKSNQSGRCVEDSAWDTRNGILLTMSDCVLGWKDYWFGL
jgi:hypothetical protein